MKELETKSYEKQLKSMYAYFAEEKGTWGHDNCFQTSEGLSHYKAQTYFHLLWRVTLQLMK